MVAQIAGFRTREQLKLVQPRSFSRNFTPQHGGVCVHWGGPGQRNTFHVQCEQTWRDWQRIHMAPGGLGTRKGAADIGYQVGFCQHGYVLAGRGLEVRPGAQGSGNQSWNAAVWVGGQGQLPTREALDALEWIIFQSRELGAANRVRDHAAFMSTACAGTVLRTRASYLNERPIYLPAESQVITAGDRGPLVREWKELASKALPNHPDRFERPDDRFGPQTVRLTIAVYELLGLTAADPKQPRVGPRSFQALREYVADLATEEWRGKVVRARSDVPAPGVRFYREPGWHPDNATDGFLPAGWRFAGGIHEIRKVGTGQQYRVSNSAGDMRWITASPRFVELV
jgi:hypothetical protein